VFGTNAYEFIEVGGGGTWDAASNAAAACVFNGVNGHLATITSQSENDFLIGLVTLFDGINGAWLGGDYLGWLEGPEAGASFSQVGNYQAWGGVEPNNQGLMYMSVGTVTPNGESAGSWLDDSGAQGVPSPDDPVIGYFVEYENVAPSFCDASDSALASCPCSNPGLPDTGCDIQQLTGGVRLNLLQQQTSPQNRVTWNGTGFPAATSPASIVIRAADLDTASPVVFGDGLRCIGTPLVRLAATFASGGSITHTHGHGTGAGSGTFYYQLWFRNTPIMFCNPTAAFNLSNGRTLTW
jgi:hypothetical protein